VEAKKQVEQLITVLSAQFTSVVAELAPDIADIATRTLDWVKANNELIGQGVDVFVRGVGDSFDFVERAITKTTDAVTKLVEVYNKFPDSLLTRFLKSQTAELEKTDDFLKSLGIVDGSVTRPINKNTPGYDQYITGLKKNSPIISRKSIPDVDGAKKLSKEVKGLIDADLEGWFNDVDQAAKKYVDLFKEGAQVTLAMRNPTEQLADETARLNELLDVGAINAETYGRAIAQAQEDIKGSAVDMDLADFFSDIDAESERLAEKTTSDWEHAFSGWASSYSSTLNDMLWGSELTFDNIAQSFAKMVTEMAIQKAIIEPFTSSLFGGLGGIFPSIFHEGGVVGSGDGGIRAVSPMVFAGAPRFHSGLMPDEFAAILQRGETVFTENQTKALGGMIKGNSGKETINVHFNISTDNPQSFNRSRGEIEAKIASTVRRARRRSG
jgi:hypothetical protein